MSEHPLDVLREARDALVVWGTEGIAEVDAALCAVEQLEPALRKCVQAIEDAYGGYAHVPEDSFEREAIDEANAALALFDRKEQT